MSLSHDAACRLLDEPKIRALRQQIAQRHAKGAAADILEAKLAQLLAQSSAAVAQRQAWTRALEFPEHLPISEKRQEIAELIAQHQVIILAGETGSGKTTQLPKICVQLG